MDKSAGSLLRSQVAERSHFFRQWIRAPLVTASIIPSSQALAAGMARSLRADSGIVVELGPGTGVITDHLLRQGVLESALILVECNPFFSSRLSGRFPSARVIQGRAEELDLHSFVEPPNVVVSGLPLMSMPNDRVEAIFDAAFRVLRPGGRLIQFTYAPRCPVNRQIRERLGLSTVLQEMVWRNIPPASVYQFHRASG